MTRRLGFDRLLQATGAFEVASDAERDTTLKSVLGTAPALENPLDLVISAEMLELEALDEREPDRRRQLLEDALACWVRLAAADDLTHLADGPVSAKLSLVLHIASTGTAADRVTETRQALNQFLESATELGTSSDTDWARAVTSDAVLAFVLLTRKGDGWSDIGLALELLQSLRDRQSNYEPGFFEGLKDQRVGALRLVAAYHLAQLVTTAGKYIETGRGSAQQTVARLDTHRSQAMRAVSEINDGPLARVIDLVHLGLRPLVERSIWAQVETLGSAVEDLANVIADRQNTYPTLELWPSQVEAMSQNLLDAYRRAVVVQMPTSAGKTLLAKFSIVQTLALNQDARIAYVVPTRVLVNQITDELRGVLGPMGYTVEQAIPVIDLDPTEHLFLSSLPNVLVTTPEKLDLLVRTAHPVVDKLSMVVVDEAHNIGEPNRGARLELVLATVRRDKPTARFLLLSPFMPNAESLSRWLGNSRGSSIQVDWKPNKKLIGKFSIRKEKNRQDGRRKDKFLELSPVAAADNYHFPSDSTLDLGEVTLDSITLSSVAAVAQKRLEQRGPTLLVCNGKAPATKRAARVASERSERDLSPRAEAVLRHVITELGADSVLATCIRRGVGYHHAGMSLETRWLVEQLVAHGDIDIVCGTTTLAQGANFPITNVIIESMTVGREEITHAQFWNIAGRAGRGMMSGLGVVGYPVVNGEQAAKWEKFFEAEATDIVSRLASVVESAEAIGTDFLSALNRSSDVESLSEFLQYLAHAFRVSGAMNSANEIEDLLRLSLVFSETERISRVQAQKLVQLCRDYLNTLDGRNSLVALADGTGFSTPAINLLLGGLSEYPSIRNPATWEPGALFGRRLEPLSDRLELISRMPELRLSPEDSTGIFDPRKAAQILRDWVNGTSITEMVQTYGNLSKTPESTHATFVSYLIGNLSQNASWGLGALGKVAFASQDTSDEVSAKYIPTMVFYGVNSPEATWMRMAGLPRDVARGAAEVWRDQQRGRPGSFDDIRSWIRNLKHNDWEAALNGTSLRPEDAQTLWTR